MPEPDDNPLLSSALEEVALEKLYELEDRKQYAHRCVGEHKPEEGVDGHHCWCDIGHDHTIQEYWEYDMNRPDEDD